MDQITHEMRTAHWLDIINRCQKRPQGMTAQRWLEENGIQRKAYYYWLRKFRTEAYLQQRQTQGVLPASQEISFAEIPLSAQSSETTGTNITDTISTVNFEKPVAVIQHAGTSIAIANGISEEMLSLILRETFHA